MSWEWTYRPGEVVERSTSVGVIREQQPASPHWPWLGETPSERVQVLALRRARVDR